MSDRTVHGCTAEGHEIARYDRAGKWWIETGKSRYPVTIDKAVDRLDLDSWRPNLPGGRRFDVLVARRRAQS